MKFGEQLQEHIHSTSAYSSQVYIDYNTLKRSIHARCTQHRAHCLAETARFKRALRKGMATVNAFFVRMEAGLLERCAESPHSAQSAASVAELQQVRPRAVCAHCPCQRGAATARARRADALTR